MKMIHLHGMSQIHNVQGFFWVRPHDLSRRSQIDIPRAIDFGEQLKDSNPGVFGTNWQAARGSRFCLDLGLVDFRDQVRALILVPLAVPAPVASCCHSPLVCRTYHAYQPSSLDLIPWYR